MRAERIDHGITRTPRKRELPTASSKSLIGSVTVRPRPIRDGHIGRFEDARGGWLAYFAAGGQTYCRSVEGVKVVASMAADLPARGLGQKESEAE